MAAPTAPAPPADHAAAEVIGGTPGAAASGSGYRATVTSGDSVVWRCSHVHFTEHSAKACAERHIAEAAAPPA